MILRYNHVAPLPPNAPVPLNNPRLRPWVGESPYLANRPLRGPRGTVALPLLEKPITFANVPRIERITVSSFLRDAQENSAFTHVAGMVLQAMTGVRATVHIARKTQTIGRRLFNQRKGKPIGVGCTLTGETMWHFLGTLVEVVGPRIKEWKGLKGSSGDGSGNLAVGFGRDVVGAWPEVEVNYDS
jgi:large subunit ribosomal protein L5